VYAAEHELLAVDDLLVTPLVDLAAAVGADVEAGLDGHRDEVGEALEESVGEGHAFFRQLVDLSLFLPDHLRIVGQ